MGMLGAEHLLGDRQRALEERPRPLVRKQQGEVVEVWMLGAEHLLADRQRALEERPCPRKVALVRKHQGVVVEARGRVGMLGAECLFGYRQCIAEKLRSLRVSRAAV